MRTLKIEIDYKRRYVVIYPPWNVQGFWNESDAINFKNALNAALKVGKFLESDIGHVMRQRALILKELNGGKALQEIFYG